MNHMKRRPTQVDVAQLAGVSRATVSYVLNGQTGGRVPISDETRRRVLEAIDELGYVPDARAQALRSGHSQTIGLIIPDIQNPHFWEVADGVEQAATAAGYHILLSSIPPEKNYAEDVFNDLAHRRIDGLIMIPSFIYQSPEAQKTLDSLLERRLPVVGIMGEHNAANYKFDRVISDYRNATIEIMQHLLGLGHTRIGFIYGIAIPNLGNDRLGTYRECLQAAGVETDPYLVMHCDSDIEDSYQATRQIMSLSSPPTALLVINDFLALGVLRALQDLGIQVPQDVSVFSYDNIPISKYLVPRLSTASKNGEKMGREAMRLLLARLENPELPQQEVRLLSRVILRESTGPAPVSERD